MNHSRRIHREKLGPALPRIDKRVTVLWIGRGVLRTQTGQAERLKMWIQTVKGDRCQTDTDMDSK